MSPAHPIRVPRFRSASCIGVSAVVLAILSAVPAAAQLVSTTDLRTACQTSPGHVVVLTNSVKILDGIRPPGTEQVLTGCTIVLGPGANFETERISMTFAGPLVIQSTDKAGIKLSMSFFAAPSVNVNLTGIDSAIETTLSGIHATTGSLLITMGDQAKLIVLERLLPGPSDALKAATTIQIRGGQKFTAQLNEMGITAPQGITIAMDGNEGMLKVEQTSFTAANNSVSISLSGDKGLVEMSESQFRFGNMLSLRASGAEALLKMKQTSAGGASDTQDAPGGVLIEAGSGAAVSGKIEVSEISLFNVATIRLLASLGGQQGGLKMEKSRISSSGNIILETGGGGATEVKENSGGSSTLIRIATGAGGSCSGQPNSFFAPVSQICP